MTSADLPDADHVVRYVRPSLVRSDGSVRGAAFGLRNDEVGLSVNWVEYWSNAGFVDPIREIRSRSRMNLRRNGRFGRLNVGATKTQVAANWAPIRFVNMPLEVADQHDADPSHTEITPLPPYRSPEADFVGNLIARSVTNVIAAVN